VIAVAVDTYTDPKIETLQSTKIDAKHFADAMATTEKWAFAAVQKTMLLDADVTPDSVLKAVRNAASQTGPDDMLIFFFAGHGVDGAKLNQSNTGLVLTTSRTRIPIWPLRRFGGQSSQKFLPRQKALSLSCLTLVSRG
jgi:uncharacterized caspase-like protein